MITSEFLDRAGYHEAWNKTVNGFMGDNCRAYFLPLLKSFGILGACKHDPDVPDSDVTVEYLAENCWLIGSAKTVEQKIADMVHASGNCLNNSGGSEGGLARPFEVSILDPLFITGG